MTNVPKMPPEQYAQQVQARRTREHEAGRWPGCDWPGCDRRANVANDGGFWCEHPHPQNGET